MVLQYFLIQATYKKNDEIILTSGNSRAISENSTITAKDFRFDRKQNIIVADKDVKFIDKIKNTKINTNKAIYHKNDEIIFTEGDTSALVENKYNFLSKNIKYNKIKQELSSKKIYYN